MRRSTPIIACFCSILCLTGCTPRIEGDGVAQRPLHTSGENPGAELIAENVVGHSVQPKKLEPTNERIASLKLPDGFHIAKFAEGLGAPRMMAVGKDGTLYVTRRDPGEVLALRDTDKDGKADKVEPVVTGLKGAHGIAIHNGTMYVCTVEALFSCAMSDDGTVGPPKKILDNLPPGGRHPNRTLAVDPRDGMILITVGSTCNCCVEPSRENAAILMLKANGTGRAIWAEGLRNTLGLAWHPKTHQLWGMDHDSDWLGDDIPPEELNLLKAGHHYGWPWVWGNGNIIPAKSFPKDFKRDDWIKKTTPPALMYTAHAAPLQMAFYPGDQFPAEYRNDAFVCMHGSWNRQPPCGYEVVRIKFDESGKPVKFMPFVTGFLTEGPAFFGRPTGIAMGTDGSMFIGDDTNGAIYRVWYGK